MDFQSLYRTYEELKPVFQLNSFMFEPILDISDHHLKHLHNDVLHLIVLAEELTSGAAEVASTQLD